MPSVYPSRSPASMPAARTVRLARRLAGGMTPAEVARIEGTSEAEILSLLEDERFADLVDYHREERELPEDERERLLSPPRWPGCSTWPTWATPRRCCSSPMRATAAGIRRTACAG